MTPEEKLAELGITLPEPAAAVANYVPFVGSGNMLFVSGQVSMGSDGLILGRLGESMELEAGQEAARRCGINLLAQCKAAVGELSNIVRVVKLGGFVNAAPSFVEIPQVINGCSNLMVDVLGDAGRHARSAVACPTLPLGVAVEIDGIFEVA
ncbi:RidA family protein [Ponticaulis sp.]|uniref:RidA family protein n=1 Tax=Ponticaulis sp. TaxID=2020902 RepID=UPI000B6E361F|nr:RidA family protein [Ponticaulis sp.]MAI89633.1 hypothetical protein [Ponticaulis sp.]OUY00656.1 MAG: hypothetical protein CBB65_04280 [Hyphomonadaceae bacterium TMED5]